MGHRRMEGRVHLEKLSSGKMLQGKEVDATANRERMRQRRLKRTLLLLAPLCGWLVYRLVTDNQIRLGMPGWLSGNPEIVIALGMILVLGTVIFICTKANPLIVVFAAGVLGYFGII